MDEDKYDHAYSSLQAVTLLADLVIGPSAGALLFSAARWLPFVVAGAVMLGSWLVLIPFFSDSRTRPARDPNPAAGWWADTIAGMRHVFKTPFIRGIAITLVGIAAAEEIVSVTVAPYVRDGSGTTRWPQALGLVRGAAGVLAVVAALMIASVAGRLGRERVMAVVAFVGGLSAAVLAIGPRWPAVFAGIAISAVAEAMWVPLAQSAIMHRTPRHLMGRTRAAIMFLTWGTLPLTSMIGGGLATTLGIRPILLIGSALALLSCAFGTPMFLRSRKASDSEAQTHSL